MNKKNGPAKIVKGGFRATLALFFSIIALVLSIITFNRTASQTEYQTEIKELRKKLEVVKKETNDLVSKISQETASAIKKMGIEIKKQEEKPESSEDQ